MATIGIKASKVFTVRKNLASSLQGAARDTLLGKFGKGKEAANILYNAAKEAPERRKILLETLLPTAAQINSDIDDVFGSISNMLTTQDQLPLARSGGVKRMNVSIGLKKVGFSTRFWRPLSKSYRERIQRMKKAGSRIGGLADKRFWYERPEHTDPKKVAEALATMTYSEFKSVLHTTNYTLFSTNGHPNGVSFTPSINKLAKVKAHIRHVNGRLIPIGFAQGEVLMPTKIQFDDGTSNAKSFADYVYGAVAAGEDGTVSLGRAGFWISRNPTLLQLLLINEYRRPFIGRAFQVATKTIIDNARKLALRRK